ncbi:MAG: ABC transporter ATP-binding protein [Deltaproteobacteria bacterium]|nr:ABC transporter ATP-binding protein [Deltaproteobacteria bacterium]
MAELTLERLTKDFGTIRAVDGVTLTVENGEFLALLGPSGCGKTTILRLIAGFERPTSGRVLFDETVMSGPGVHVAPEQRRVGIVFQSYALWPHMSVADNVGYPLRVAGVNARDRGEPVLDALTTVGLESLAARRPADLSGGQRQRVALARCLVMKPRLLLFDEPLANLDVHLRAAMQDQFVDLHRTTRTTIIYITHDQAEAMAMADRIAVMSDGRIEQTAAPETLYDEPETPMVGNFIGEGVIVEAILVEAPVEGHGRARVFGHECTVRAGNGVTQGPVRLCLRPEALRPDEGRGFAATVRRTSYRGGVYAVDATVGDAKVPVRLWLRRPPAIGRTLRIAVDDAWVIPSV